MGSALRLHPLLVIFGLLAGGEIYGLAGILVALPLLAAGRAVYEYFSERVQLEPWAEGGPVPVEVEIEPAADRSGPGSVPRRLPPAGRRAALTAPALLAAHGVARRFGAHVALEPTDLEVHGGEAVALVGPNGAGKSTLLAILAGALEPSDGTVERADGVRAGWMPQRPAHYGRLSPRAEPRVFARLERGAATRTSCSRGSSSRRTTGRRRRSRSATGSGSTSRSRCSRTRRSCSSTSRPRRSTLASGGGCGRPPAASATPAARSSWSRRTSRTSSTWPTGSSRCSTGRWSSTGRSRRT